MVLPYYQLREQPFGVTPDSRYFYLSNTHREALASLLYGVDAGCGFLAVIAAPGLGKTTLLFDALRCLRQAALTVFLFGTVCTPLELLRSLLTALGVKDAHGNVTRMQSRLQDVLIEQARLGKRVVVVMDEAQNLDHAVLELIRMLSNFETPQQKLLQIILAGQPPLAEKIASPGLEQLRQRISIFAHLKPFSREETQLYIEHRLRVAGYTLEASLFTRDALALIAGSSGGVPRSINNLCFNALSLGYARKKHPLDATIITEVIADLDIDLIDRWKKKTLSRPPAPPIPNARAVHPGRYATP
jgi:general secretion pathway protein A